MTTKPKLTIPPALKSLPDAELAEILGCSRQAVLFRRRRDAHQCVKCASPVLDGSPLCDTHRKEQRKYQRNRNRKLKGHKPWKPGRRGRPITGEAA